MSASTVVLRSHIVDGSGQATLSILHPQSARKPTSEPDAPLIVPLELTPAQRRTIFEQTGRDVAVIPIEAAGASVRCRFGGLDLEIPRGVFVPTPSSERTFALARGLAEAASRADRAPVVVDVGTGAGAIGLAIAHAVPSGLVYGTDLSRLALRAARRNRARLGLRNVRFVLGSLLSPLPARLGGRVDVIVANVPYLPPNRTDLLDSFPSGTAMGTEQDGLGLIREVARRARALLRPGGRLVLQMAEFQWPLFTGEASELGYVAAELARHDGPGPIAAALAWPGSELQSHSP